MTAKGQRRSREELRALLIRTGRTLLREEGLGTGAESLSFKRVFDRVEFDTGVRLTNASVIRRIWENQADFQTDVLVDVALAQNEGDIDRTVKAVEPTLSAVDLGSLESRLQAMRELCRIGGAANMQAVRQSDNWPSWIAIWAVAADGESTERRKRVTHALMTGYETFTERIEAVYAAMTAYLGFRLREGFTLRQFSIAVDALGQGCGLRERVDDSMLNSIVRKTGPRGETQEWTLFAVAFEALVHQFFEIDPEWMPGSAEF